MMESAFTVESDGLKLEGALHEGGDELAAVMLHPHPQYGGDMDNHVVLAVCQTLAELGATTLRFNFRGAGRSQGTHDQGRGEANDARAACAALRELRPDARLLLAGYSFGAIIATMVAADVQPDAMALISPPLRMASAPSLDGSVSALLITGGRDQIAPADSLRELEGSGRTIVVVPGVDHSWWPGLDELSQALRSFVSDSVLAAKGQN
jgi:alpha/beta superfamily hydrolase